MMSSWILVISAPYDEFTKRINRKVWPIYKNTPNKTKLRIGDDIIFYLGGIHGKKFLGSARVNSELIPGNTLDFSINLSEIKVWKNPLLIKEILDDLKFIIKKDKWGVHLQGGIIRLPYEDHIAILSKIKKSDKT